MQPISPALAAPGCNAGFDQPLPAPETASGKTPGLLQQGQKPISDSMWSQVPAVQVMAFRLLNRLSSEGWARDLVDMMYLDDETREWAESELSSEESTAPTLDSNGSVLKAQCPPPEYCNQNHLKGYWLTQSHFLLSTRSITRDVRFQIPQKVQWLNQNPVAELLDHDALIRQLQPQKRPVYIRAIHQALQQQMHLFIVPDDWPERAMKVAKTYRAC
ncbi:hypothetical protein J7438_19720 [Thalassotalea sp. G20_0]|uniref:hypothetical protein n=1 Tax=Thalassotalea sp. G20_0 TaxID=2821093 RepID=UPI001ADC8681|nr:hypothetical protein [Thalassotalea sp. G20_0]MBO9496287.1 hypothetical protein [Thalassotalea sp. G20_0]